MSVKIITDTASDFPLGADQRVVMLPLTVTFGNQQYKDIYELSHEQFYEKLAEADELPSTAQANPAAFEEAYKKIVADGDEAVVITISSLLSGTYQSACIAAEDYSDTIFPVDSLNATVGELIIVQRALQLIDEGKTAKEIQEILNEEKHDIVLVAVVDTLKYLYKGGRVSATTAFVGNALSIKPILAIEKGVIVQKGQARGTKKANAVLNSFIKESGICYNKPVAAGYTGLSDEQLLRYFEESKDIYQDNAAKIGQYSIGGTIGTHVGPGAIIITYFAK